MGSKAAHLVHVINRAFYHLTKSIVFDSVIFMDTSKIIPINDLRRKFGDIEKSLPFVDRFILTKKGKPFAVLMATPEAKKERMNELAGALKGTGLDNDEVWKEVLKRKSRKKTIEL